MRIAVLASAFWIVLASALPAETILRWKLTPGENLSVAVSQTTKSAVSYAGKKTQTEITLDMELRWRVLAADGDQVRFEQSIQRLSVSLDAPPAGRVQFDSASPDKPTGSAKDLAAALAPLLAARIEIKMNDRGQVLGATSSSDGGEPAGPAGAPSLVSKESIQQLLKQPLALLPDKPVDAIKMWQKANDLTTSLGPAKQTTTYTYVGPVELDGQKLEKIASQTELLPESPAGTKLMLKSQSQTGEILFDAAAGRVAKAVQKQKLVTERPYRETTIVVSLESEQTTTIGPVKDSAKP